MQAITPRLLNTWFVCWALLLSSQSVGAVEPLAAPFDLESIATRRASAQQQLDALGAVDEEVGEDERRAATRSALEQIIATLVSIEEASSKRAEFAALLAALPQRQEEVARELRQVENRVPPRFERVTDAMLEQYDEDRQAARAEIERLIRSAGQGEVRAGAILRQRQQLDAERPTLESALGTTRGEVASSADSGRARLRVELAKLRLASLGFTLDAIRAERTWLVESRPLQDERLRLAKLRLENVQVDLQAIQTALGRDLEETTDELRTQEAEIARQLEVAGDSAKAEQLRLGLETVKVRRATAKYRQQRARLTDRIEELEERSARVRRTVDRLASLVDTHALGQVPAARLLTLFQRLREERNRYGDGPGRNLQGRLALLNEELFRLDDRLYEYDQEMERRHLVLAEELAHRSAAERSRTLRDLRSLAGVEKRALREQQEVLGRLVDDIGSILALSRAQRRFLDDTYREALGKVFWIRDAEPLSPTVVATALAGLATLGSRTATQMGVVAQAPRARLSAGAGWGLGILLFVVLPWGAARAYRWLGSLAAISFAEQTKRGEAPGLNPAMGILVQSAIWPVFLLVVAGVVEQSLPEPRDPFALASLSGVRLVALILGITLFGRRLLGPDGWGQHFWELSPELCQLLRRAVLLGSLAALLLIVPRHVLLAAPGEPDVAGGSTALARLLFLALQVFAIPLVAVLGRRGSPLMQQILAPSREHDGFLWRFWPVVHAAVLLGLLGVLGLGALGYHFAALTLWYQVFGAIGIIAVLRLFVAVYVLLLAHKLLGSLFDRPTRLAGSDESVKESAGRAFSVMRVVVNTGALLLALAMVLELWGVKVSEAMTSPVAFRIMTRGLGALLVTGVAVVLVQLSRAITANVLRRAPRGEITFETGRKLRTLAPLVQTSFSVVVVFVATVVLLRVIGLDTAPILAGVGILGLAVGFAAQSLIKDIINGLFILFEDSLSVGDIVNIGGRGGQVEKVTLRAVTIRDLQGHVHVVPNGAIDVVTNLTKGFSRYLLDVGVAYRENVDEVISILREIDEEMRADPAFRTAMLEPIEILGLDRFENSAVIVRGRLKTRPIEQWRVGREFNRRMKRVFDERGIEIPFPHRTLYWGEPKEGPQRPIGVAVEADNRAVPAESSAPHEREPDHSKSE